MLAIVKLRRLTITRGKFLRVASTSICIFCLSMLQVSECWCQVVTDWCGHSFVTFHLYICIYCKTLKSVLRRFPNVKTYWISRDTAQKARRFSTIPHVRSLLRNLLYSVFDFHQRERYDNAQHTCNPLYLNPPAAWSTASLTRSSVLSDRWRATPKQQVNASIDNLLVERAKSISNVCCMGPVVQTEYSTGP